MSNSFHILSFHLFQSPEDVGALFNATDGGVADAQQAPGAPIGIAVEATDDAWHWGDGDTSHESQINHIGAFLTIRCSSSNKIGELVDEIDELINYFSFIGGCDCACV